MRKLFSILFLVIAGFFIYMLQVLGFVQEVSAGAKWGVIFAFTIPALLTLCAGLALARFHGWKRSTGIVFLSSSGVMVFVAVNLACLFASEDFRKMVKPETAAFFGDYLTGFTLIAGCAITGCLLLKADSNRDKANRQST
jgi:uncharacterized membrane protein YhaH (DUF805 family)